MEGFKYDSAGAWIYKDPDATLDYIPDWAAWLQAGETIVTSTWDVPVGLTKGSDTIGVGKTSVWISGGTIGQTYIVTNRITTSMGRTDDRSFRIKVKSR